jgi:hypothetical protein
MTTRNLLPLLFSLLITSSAWGVIALNGPTDDWTAIELGGRSDFLDDEQAQSSAGDIVGDDIGGNQLGFYKQYETGGAAGNAGDFLAFRVRVGNDGKAHLYIGVDIISDGPATGTDTDIDFYIGFDFGNNNSNQDNITFYNPGSDLNVSPATSSFSSEFVYKQGSDLDFSTYGQLTGVSSTNDSALFNSLPGSTNDINGDGQDYFVSFQVEMSVLNAVYLGMTGNSGNPDITASTEMSFVVTTSTNGSNFNQDFGGVPKDFDDTETWSDLGISSSTYTADGTSPVPEPATYALLFGFFVMGFAAVRRRR